MLVVHLSHFDVIFGTENRCGLLDEFHQQVDAQRIVAALDDRDHLGRRIDRLLLLGGNARRANHVRNAFARRLGNRRRHARVVGEVDNSLDPGRPSLVIPFRDIDLRDDLEFGSLREFTQFLAHTAGRADNCDFHCLSSLS